VVNACFYSLSSLNEKSKHGFRSFGCWIMNSFGFFACLAFFFLVAKHRVRVEFCKLMFLFGRFHLRLDGYLFTYVNLTFPF
jgi:hypothetical protein